MPVLTESARSSASGPHDPGAASAEQRATRVERAAAEPIEIGTGNVRIGTASWTDPTMTARGVFYPDDATTPEARLQHYADRAPLSRGCNEMRPAMLAGKVAARQLPKGGASALAD